ncbi:MAG: type III pantothenate kinase [Bacteroidota bacterium]|nr:type III pantothenate kinase [Bacteroidota bacterium]
MKRLAVLLGNTTCRLAWMDGDAVLRTRVFDHAAVGDGRAAEALQADAAEGAFDEVEAAGICSVVPSLQPKVESLLTTAGCPAARVVRPITATWFPSRYRSMDTLGADRFCAVLAARQRVRGPLVVIDCGTATTVNVVDRAGDFRGGAIAPGVGTSFAALHEHTAQLPVLAAAPTPLIGDDSASCIRAGVLHFTRIALEGMLREAGEITGPDAPVFLTGGNAPVLLGAGLSLPHCTHDPELLFRGVIFFLHFTA